MSKVKLMIEMDEKYYNALKQTMGVYLDRYDQVSAKLLKSIINATPITESDDCVSRPEVEKLLRCGCAYDIWNLPPVLPKREQGEWKMIYRHHNEVKKYTGTDLMGDKHTIYVHEEYEGKEPYCSKCGKRADDLGQSFCGYCGAEMRWSNEQSNNGFRN